jgi:hypothetical protein
MRYAEARYAETMVDPWSALRTQFDEAGGGEVAIEGECLIDAELSHQCKP